MKNDKYLQVKYYLQIISMSCSNISYHIIARKETCDAPTNQSMSKVILSSHWST